MHLLKLIFCRSYREATKLANEANRIFADMMISSRAVRG